MALNRLRLFRAVSARVPVPRWRTPVWLFLVLAAVGGARAADDRVVDGRPALAIGDFTVSRYRLDKQYREFRALHSLRPPTAGETAEWFRLFIAQRMIEGELVHAGYLERTDVRSAVQRMSQYILTRPDGEFYEKLYNHQPVAAARVKAALVDCLRSRDACVVRFDDETVARAYLGDAQGERVLAERLQSLPPGGVLERYENYSGPLVWPFHPFEEVQSDVLAAMPGRVVGPLVRRLGVYYLVVHWELPRQAAEVDTTPAEMERYLRLLDDSVARRARSREVVHAAQLQVVRSTVDELAGRFRAAKSPSSIGGDLITGLEHVTLATYIGAGRRRTIDVAGFAARFNEQVMHAWPTSAGELATAIEELFVNDADWRDARAGGFDRDPRFVADQRNFALAQALALYERKILLPRVEVSDEELHSFYVRHQREYAVPTSVSGTLYVFDTRRRALTALNQLTKPAPGASAIQADSIVDDFRVERDGANVIAGTPNALLLNIPEGRPFGPFKYRDQWAVFVHRSPVKLSTPRFAEVATTVRRQVFRRRLDLLELGVLRRNPVPVRVYADLSRYDISSSMLPSNVRLLEVSPAISSSSPSHGTRDVNGGEGVVPQNQSQTQQHI